MKLFLDDIRMPSDCTNYMASGVYRLFEWKIVRNYNEFVLAIQKEFPDTISFDHDLAHEHYEDLMSNENWDKANNTIKLKYNNYKEKTGYDCCKWLINYCIDNKLKLPEIIVHSMNPVGKENILGLIRSFKKQSA
jgi:hypothetical protein